MCLPHKAKILLLLLFLFLGLAGCERADMPIKVGANVWPGYEPLFLAQSLGYLDNSAIELATFPSTTEVMRAYRNNVIDVAAVTLDEALSTTEHKRDQRVILVCDFSSGADVLIARPEFDSLAALKGKRVGIEQNALGAYMLSRALDFAGLDPSDITVVGVPLEVHEDYFRAGKVDAVVTFDPQASRITAAGGRILFDSSKIPGEVVDVLLTNDAVVKKSGKNIASLVSGWFKALDYLASNPEDAARRVSKREQVTPAEFLKSLSGLTLPSREENLRLLDNSPESLAKTASRMREVMFRGRLIEGKDWPLPELDATYVGRAAK